MRRYGWKKDTHDRRDHLFGVARPRLLPSRADVRQLMPSGIWDQRDSNSCTGQSSAAAIQRAENDEWMPSAAFIYWNARQLEGTTDQDGGCMIRSAIKAIAKFGVCHDDYWTYNPGAVLKKPPPEAYAHARGGLITKYQRVSQSLAAIKGCLVDGNPIVFGFSVFEQFESKAMAQTGVLAMPKSKDEQPIGGHAVVIVGYRDDWRRVLVRNSYGQEWGMRDAPGHFAMPYDYLLDPALCSDFWVVGSE